MKPNGCRAVLGIFLGLILAVPARSQFIVPIPKTDNQAVVPQLEGLDQTDAEKAILSAGLVLGRMTEKESDLPEGTVIKQSPAPGAKVARGTKVSLVVSKGEPAASSPASGSGGRVKIPSLEGKSFSEAYQTLSDLGFTVIKPKRIEGTEPPETVVAVLVGGRPVNLNTAYPFGAELTVLVSSGSGEETLAPESLTINTAPLVMTGMRVNPITINAQPLVMTGMRVQPITIATDTLKMTGMRPESITINTQPLVMTGIRPESITLTTQPLVMTGIRVESITINTEVLKMTGMRETGQPRPPIESDKTIRPPVEQPKLKIK
jgi:beta-lactam-binding protein with PASTA domain